MGFFSRFESRIEDTFDNAADKLFDSPISPVQIAKRAEKEMRREKMVGAGKQYAPTLYTVLVNPNDDRQLFGYYPTLAGETETYLAAKASEHGFVMDGQPLVRFVVDDSLRRGKFDIIAELVSKPIIEHLRHDEMTRYGIAPHQRAARQAAPAGFIPANDAYGEPAYDGPIMSAPIPGSRAEEALESSMAHDFHFNDQLDASSPDFSNTPLPKVPEGEIDRSINYGEYTFNSQDFFDAGNQALAAKEAAPTPSTPAPAPHANAPAQAGFTSAPAPSPRAVHSAPSHAQASQAAAAGVSVAHLVDLVTHKQYPLVQSVVTLGRDTRNTIVVSDLNASRNHAEIRKDAQGRWILTDLGSTNGTKLNAQRISSQVLHAGDRITIGVTNYSFRM